MKKTEEVHSYHPVRAWLIRQGLTISWLAEQIDEHRIALTAKLASDPDKRRPLMDDEAEEIAKVTGLDLPYIKGPNVSLSIEVTEPAA